MNESIVTPWRVGLVCPYSFSHAGGVQNHVIGLAGWLNAQGHSVAIMGPGQPAPGLLEREGLDPSVFTSSGSSVPFAYNGSVARINFGPTVAWRVQRWLDRGGFEVLHLHEAIAPNTALLALWQTASPVVVTFHAAVPSSRWMRFANATMPRTITRIDAPIAVSNIAYDVAHRHYGLHPRVIGNGINIADHVLRPHDPSLGPWRGGEHPRLTFLGRYNEPRKGFEVLRAAMPAIREAYPDVEVAVVGHGTPIPEPNVRYLGFLSDAERDALLARTDVYIAPQTGRESFGIVLLEAMASGAPVVASDLQAFREVLTDERGIVGHLAAVGDAGALAIAILRSLTEPRDLWLERGRARAMQFDWSQVGPAVLESYAYARDVSGTHHPLGRTRPAFWS